MNETALPQAPRILIVEDEAITAMDLAAELRRFGYEICGIVDNANDAVETALREQPQLVLMDIHLSDDGDGIEASRRIAGCLDTAVVFLTAHSDDATLSRALEVSPYGYIVKPFRWRDLKVAVEVAIGKHAQEQTKSATMSALALTDPLTGLGNRRRFDEAMRSEWTRAIREQKSLAVLMLDIDHFKAFNDNYGHALGDVCLQSVAAVLRDRCSRPGDLVCRWGGEEFAVILPGTDQAGAGQVARDLVEVVRTVRLEHGGFSVPLRVTISAGAAAAWPGPAESAEQLVESADSALYAAKQSGRDRAVEATRVEPLSAGVVSQQPGDGPKLTATG